MPEPAATNATAAFPAGRDGARAAQRLYERGRFAEAAEAYLQAVAGAGPRDAADFRYNAALAHYQAGRFREACDLLRGLAVTAAGDRLGASMALGAALYREAGTLSGQDATNLTARAERLQQSAEAFKAATRQPSDSGAALRNLGVVLRDLPAAEEQARIARLMAEHGQTPAPELAGRILESERDVLRRSAAALTNDSPEQVRQLEAVAAAQKSAADLWIPLKGKLLEALASRPQDTNAQQQAAYVHQAIEATRDRMLNAAAALRDLDGGGYAMAHESEAAIYRFWKGIAPFPALLREDIRAESNVIDRTRAPLDAEAWRELAPLQAEARSLTGLFRERFAEAVPEEGLPAPAAPAATNAPGAGAATNAPGGISAEDRRKIMDLAAQALNVQSNAVAAIAAGERARAHGAAVESHRLLKEIEDLLPKDQNSQQPQDQNQQQQPKPDDQQQDQNPQPQQDQQPPEPSPPKPEEQPKPKDLDQQKLQQLLDKALQREKEHQERQRDRREYTPPSAIERDW